jgi:hypothetical protein
MCRFLDLIQLRRGQQTSRLVYARLAMPLHMWRLPLGHPGVLGPNDLHATLLALSHRRLSDRSIHCRSVFARQAGCAR